MKSSTLFLVMMALLSLLSPFSYAEKVELSEVESRLASKFLTTNPSLPVQHVEETPVEGIYAVQVVNGPMIYTTAEGDYFVLGDLYQVENGRFVNLAEKGREAKRAEQLATVAVEDMIVFAPKDQPVKAVVTVFTDVDCFYCQKLHREVPDLNRAGIELRYLAYPRAGLGSDSYKKIASAWCAKDKQAAMTKLKNRQKIPANVCEGNPVAAQFKLGNQMGVNGTPALLTEDGRLMPGYMPALQLAKALGVKLDPELEEELIAKMEASK
jgi:thiol:disulfide interchange protein DsbC